MQSKKKATTKQQQQTNTPVCLNCGVINPILSIQLFACWGIFHDICRLFFFFFLKIVVFVKNLSISRPEQLGPISSPTFSARIWVQTVCKGYQQTAIIATSNERVKLSSLSLKINKLGNDIKMHQYAIF